MTLTEALRLLNSHKDSALPVYRVCLACGFTPLHCQTLLAAELQRALPQHKVEVSPGLFGDLAGTVERAASQHPAALAVLLEWPDLDPRLGYRSLGGWTPRDWENLESSVPAALSRLRQAFTQVPAGVSTAVCLPALPPAPVFSVAGWQSSPVQLRLDAELAAFAAWLAARPDCRLVNAAWLAENSPPAGRFDAAKELQAGFPYTMAHAAAAAVALARLLAPPAPLKGLITDLDDTLWRGIVGDDGPENVAWDLAGHGQIHGLYQKLLRSFAEQGVLVGVASKNEPSVVRSAFARPDILLPEETIFPFEVHWHEKSGSVARILEQWNIAADAVAFVDDNPREVEEVQAAHPGLQTYLFPRDPAAALGLLAELRNRFGREQITEEDRLRRVSLQSQSAQREASIGVPLDTLLEQSEAELTFELHGAASPDARVLELVNKTNQFNLNGRRHTLAEWQERLRQPGAFVLVASYQDKFGPLGKIAVLQGRLREAELWLETWVMSCRAFSRRIEHASVNALFERFPAATVLVCDYQATPRNGPLTGHLAELSGSAAPAAPCRIERSQFERVRPALPHRVVWKQSPAA
jgi:FkbH-like protein